MTDDLHHRDIEVLNQSIRDLNTTITSLRQEMASTYVRKDVLEPTITSLRTEVDRHSDWLLWAQRIVIGAVLLALLGLVVMNGAGS